MTEAVLQGAIIDAARALGWIVYHTHDSRRSEPGFPDLVLVRRGRLIFAELKSATGSLRREQENWLGELRRVRNAVGSSAVEVHEWRPADWADGTVERVLRAA